MLKQTVCWRIRNCICIVCINLEGGLMWIMQLGTTAEDMFCFTSPAPDLLFPSVQSYCFHYHWKNVALLLSCPYNLTSWFFVWRLILNSVTIKERDLNVFCSRSDFFANLLEDPDRLNTILRCWDYCITFNFSLGGWDLFL